jgi:hypothetical protein
VSDEPASVEALTTVRVGDGAGVHLVIAQLSDVAVLAPAAGPSAIGDRVTVSDASDGGFVVDEVV